MSANELRSPTVGATRLLRNEARNFGSERERVTSRAVISSSDRKVPVFLFAVDGNDAAMFRCRVDKEIQITCVKRFCLQKKPDNALIRSRRIMRTLQAHLLAPLPLSRRGWTTA